MDICEGHFFQPVIPQNLLDPVIQYILIYIMNLL